jgi:hypothetical protein
MNKISFISEKISFRLALILISLFFWLLNFKYDFVAITVENFGLFVPISKSK